MPADFRGISMAIPSPGGMFFLSWGITSSLWPAQLLPLPGEMPPVSQEGKVVISWGLALSEGIPALRADTCPHMSQAYQSSPSLYRFGISRVNAGIWALGWACWHGLYV